jgi:hypothetical protein
MGEGGDRQENRTGADQRGRQQPKSTDDRSGLRS